MDNTFISKKTVYAVQPYRVGNKTGNSMAMILPAKLVQLLRITPSSVFLLQVSDGERTIVLKLVEASAGEEGMDS